MGTAQRYSTEQIVQLLRETERLQEEGATIAQVCQSLGCSEQTYYRWRAKYGDLDRDEAVRLTDLRREVSRLRRMVDKQELDISMLRELSRGNF